MSAIAPASTPSSAAGDELDGPTLKKMFEAEAEAARAIEKDPANRERFDHTYQWTLGWNLVAPGATYENTVNNRAWQ